MKQNIFAKEKGKTFILFIVLALFLGFFLGWTMNTSTLTDIELELENLNLDLRSFNEYIAFAEIFELDSCDSVFIEYLGRKIYESGVTLEAMEEEGQMDTPEYDLLKQRHNINQVIYYSELKKFKDECDFEKNVILFFFDGTKPEESTKQGRVIGEVSQEKEIILLPMDYGYTEHIDYFYEYHSPKKLPTLIINYETKLEGHQEKQVLLNNLKWTRSPQYLKHKTLL